nr:hypothetical protein [Tanacetum cinerariifolium]
MISRPRHAYSLNTKSNSTIRRHKTRNQFPRTSNSSSKVSAAKVSVVSAVKGKKGKWGNPQQALKDKGVIDIGYSRHMTGNTSYLSDFEELSGGYVAFRSNPKGGKITGKGKIKTGTGPTWLFNIDSLTRTMNYQPVHARNQTNSGIEDAPFDGKEHDFDVQKPKSKFILSPSSSAQLKEQDDKTKKEAQGKNAYQLPDDPDMPKLEDIIYSDDEDVVGAEADFNNLDFLFQRNPRGYIKLSKIQVGLK